MRDFLVIHSIPPYQGLTPYPTADLTAKHRRVQLGAVWRCNQGIFPSSYIPSERHRTLRRWKGDPM